MELTLENVQQLQRTTGSPLVWHTCDYIQKAWGEYADKRSIFADVVYNGCYLEIYNDCRREIDNKVLAYAHKYELTNLSQMFGEQWDTNDPYAFCANNQNILSWYGLKETMTMLAPKFDIYLPEPIQIPIAY